MANRCQDLLIGVVGNCASGKTTLVTGLQQIGYRAVNIAQEHSTVLRLWQRKNPDFLVCLSCTLETAKSRREIYWTQQRLDDQWVRLAVARENADLLLATDGMSIQNVLDTVVREIKMKDCDARNL
jgi:deoxyadenosine/deoxycytidine kinase